MADPYAQLNTQDVDASFPTTSNSPPPSFRSRASSPRRPEAHRLLSNEDRELADTFESPSDDEDDGESQHQLDDRQRVMSGRPVDRSTANTEPATPTTPDGRPAVERRVTQLPVFSASQRGTYGGGNAVHDGVFANLSAKPERGDPDVEEKPPTYEQAAADATPPYWETTILTPGGTASDNDVYIDGLPVGTFFSFVWNAMISMSFQLVGFLLTYLLHTTHAAKNGSKAGLGITLIQYGFSMKRDFLGNHPSPDPNKPANGDPANIPGGDTFVPPPPDPNNHDFDPNAAVPTNGFVANADDVGNVGDAVKGMRATDWFAYALMIVGWFILIRAISQYFKARRHEQLVLQSPSRGLNVPVVAQGEGEQAA
ncbi:MAG: hypothetical protein Q9162_005472 [Coniocarpon cinnabarinum]